MKKVLIISPHFPPVNTADMQRVRMSLPYFEEFGWQPTVIAVKSEFTESPVDNDLLKSIPPDIDVHYVNAFSTAVTRKFGLGNIGFRSMLHIFIKCRYLLKEQEFNLVYFTTTAFPVMALGRLITFFYKVPFILDIQDPWRPDHYLNKPKKEQPPKFKLSYFIQSLLEKFTIPYAAGIIAVSSGYIRTFRDRYKLKRDLPMEVITFGASAIDFKILNDLKIENPFFTKEGSIINLVYIGRGGYDLHYALNILFKALVIGLATNNTLFAKIRLNFIGTSYAKTGTGIKTILPLAEEYGLSNIVVEITDRIPYFQTLTLLREADLLLIPGSTEANYTASKLYPYILARKNILALFHEESSVVSILNKTKAGKVVTYNLVKDNIDDLVQETLQYLTELLISTKEEPKINWNAFSSYTAKQMTKEQAIFFDKVISKFNF